MKEKGKSCERTFSFHVFDSTSCKFLYVFLVEKKRSVSVISLCLPRREIIIKFSFSSILKCLWNVDEFM